MGDFFPQSLRKELAVRARIGDGALLFVQGLSSTQGSAGAQPVEDICFTLQQSQVVEIRDRRSALLLLDGGDTPLVSTTPCQNGFRLVLVVQPGLGPAVPHALIHRLSIRQCLELRRNLIVRCRSKGLNLLLAFGYQSKDRSLNAPDGDERAIPPGEATRGIDSDEPVCLRTRQRRPAQVVVLCFRPQLAKPVSNTLLSVRRKPQT